MNSSITSASSEAHLHGASGAEGSEGAGNAHRNGRTEEEERSAERPEGAEGVEGTGEGVKGVEGAERSESAPGADTAVMSDPVEEGAVGPLSHKSSPHTSGGSLSAMSRADATDVDAAGMSKNGHLDTERRAGAVPLSLVGDLGTGVALQSTDSARVGALPPVSSVMAPSHSTPSPLTSECRATLPPQFTLPAIQLGHIAALRPDVPETQCKVADEAAVTAEEGSGTAHTLAVRVQQLKTEAQGVPSSADPVAMDVEQGQSHAMTAPSASLQDSTWTGRTVGSKGGNSTGTSEVFDRCSETFGLTRTSALSRIDHTAAELHEHSMHMFFAASARAFRSLYLRLSLWWLSLAILNPVTLSFPLFVSVVLL